MSPGWKVPVNTIFKSFPASPSLPTVVRLIDKIKPLTSVEEVSVCVGSTVGRTPCKLDGASFAVDSAVFALVRLFVVFTGSELSVLLFIFSVLIEFSAVLEVFESVFISSLVDLSVTFVLTDVFVSLALIAEVSFDFNVTVFSWFTVSILFVFSVSCTVSVVFAETVWASKMINDIPKRTETVPIDSFFKP